MRSHCGRRLGRGAGSWRRPKKGYATFCDGNHYFLSVCLLSVSGENRTQRVAGRVRCGMSIPPACAVARGGVPMDREKLKQRVAQVKAEQRTDLDLSRG